MNSKRIQAKGWFLTYPKCDISKEAALPLLEAVSGTSIVEYVIAQELHKDGTPHLHAFLKYSKKVDWKSDRWDIGGHHGNYQVAKSWRAVQKYCQKTGDFISNLNADIFKGKHVATNAQLLSMPAKQAVDDGLIPLIMLPNLIKAKNAYALQEEAKDQETVRGVWVYGKPGVGKSHRVRTSEPSLYIKAQNKWWDGYQGEEAVLIDDFDHGGKVLGHYLKIWADRWKCTGEVKGGTIPLNFKRLYITSNYTIDELFPDDLEMQAAIRRRFKIEHIIGWNNDKSVFD